MKRTTVKLPDDLDALLRDEAKRRGSTISAMTREAIEAFLGVGRPRRFLTLGAGASTDGRSIAHDYDQIMAEIADDLYRRKMGREP